MKSWDRSHIKDKNRKIVYDLVSSVKEISKAEISRVTGISSPTTIKIVNFFLEKGILVEGGQGHNTLGRKSQIYIFNNEVAFSIGVEFEGDYLRIGLVDLAGNIKAAHKINVKDSFINILDSELYKHINFLLQETDIDKEKILGIGLGIPGIIDSKNYEIKLAPLIGITDKICIKKYIDKITEKLGVPVYIENDVNAAAVGEFVTRNLSNQDDLVYFSLGTGFGAGIILNGELRKGQRHSAGEIGYMVFDPEFPISTDKTGWMENVINLRALKRKVPSFLENDNLNKEDQEFIANYLTEYLVLSIYNISVILDVNIVVIGGIVSEYLGDILLDKINDRLDQIPILKVKCEFEASNEPGVVGTASLATEVELDYLLTD